MASAPPPPPRPIRACLFDMDGLLLDSEDLYTICTNKVLREYGKPDLPWNIKAQMQGRPGPAASKLFQDWSGILSTDYVSKLSVYQREIFPSAKPLPGVVDLLHKLSTAPNMEIALATSSHAGNYALKTTNNKELFKLFPDDQKILGDDKRIPAGRGKPAPDIYLLALKTVNDALEKKGHAEKILPEECLVFEDSVPGVEAGRRAGMQVVWCPHPGLLQEYSGREKQVLAGLMGEHKEDIQPVVETAGQRVPGAPGELDDGWAVLLHSLEDFPYAQFGIQVNKTENL